jgi:hypothetical protein
MNEIDSHTSLNVCRLLVQNKRLIFTSKFFRHFIENVLKNIKKQFFLSGKDFHRINQLSRTDKKYSIVFEGFVFHLIKEQMILLSLSAFDNNREYDQPFVISKYLQIFLSQLF